MSSNRNSRAAGLGSLLASPAPTAEEDPDFAAHQARRKGKRATAPDRLWAATDNRSSRELARVYAPDADAAVARVSEETGLQGGFSVMELEPETAEPKRLPARTGRTTGALAQRGAPAVLPRERTKRIPRDKLTVQVPSFLIDGLAALVERDGTRRYDEVETALRAHLEARGIELEEE
jgi:hypothetical protein